MRVWSWIRPLTINTVNLDQMPPGKGWSERSAANVRSRERSLAGPTPAGQESFLPSRLILNLLEFPRRANILLDPSRFALPCERGLGSTLTSNFSPFTFFTVI